MGFLCAAEGCHSDVRKRGRYGYMQNVKFYPFPTKLKAPRQRKIWIDLLRRKNYEPKEHHRVCSLHFVGGCPTEKNPFPTLFAYNNYKVPVQPRVSTAVQKRSRVKITDNTESTDLETDGQVNQQIPLSKIQTDEASGIDELDEEIIIETTPFDGMAGRKHVPAVGDDHTYFHMDHANKDVKFTREIETQTDTTLHDMRRFDQQTELLNDKKKLMRELFVEKITESDNNVKTYLGVPSVVTLYGIFAILEKISPVLKYWRGRGTTSHQTAYQRNGKQKTGPQRKLTSFHEFLITLLRIKLALPTNVLADIFGTSNTRISQIFSTWTNFMSAIFSSMLKWPNSKKVKKHMPSSFRSMYPKTTCIIDCTEFHIEKPATPTAQAKTYSTYKSCNTFKALVSVTPSGAFSYISNLWGGNVSDRFITEHCGFLDHIRKGDEVMADRGFIIRDLLLERGASLNIPPFTKKCSWGKGKRLTAADIKKTRKIAKLRIHVERAIGRLKNYRILSNTLPLKLKPLSNQIVKISAFLCNLQPPLVKQ